MKRCQRHKRFFCPDATCRTAGKRDSSEDTPTSAGPDIGESTFYSGVGYTDYYPPIPCDTPSGGSSPDYSSGSTSSGYSDSGSSSSSSDSGSSSSDPGSSSCSSD